VQLVSLQHDQDQLDLSRQQQQEQQQQKFKPTHSPEKLLLTSRRHRCRLLGAAAAAAAAAVAAAATAGERPGVYNRQVCMDSSIALAASSCLEQDGPSSPRHSLDSLQTA
jgi:hypothetical protein